MKILYATFELAPFTKVGGLADVMGALPKFVQSKNDKIAIFAPLIGSVDKEAFNIKLIENSKIFIRFGFAQYVFNLYMCKLPDTDINVFFIDNPKFYSCFKDVYPAGIDSWYEQERFICFSKAVLEYAKLLNFKPDIIHCNDWHTSMIPVWLKTTLKNDSFYKNTKTVFSIHNLAYQGKYFPEILDFAGLNKEEVFHQYGLEHYGILIWLKGALNYADKLITVSPKYAQEILSFEHGEGLDWTLNNNKNKLTGILNGLDYKEFNPEKDLYIKHNFSSKNISDKSLCKKEIMSAFSLEYKENRPLIAMVSRIVEQKGFDLFKNSGNEIKNLCADIIILGTGDKKYEDFLLKLSKKHSNVKVKIEYGKEICNKIYAGADMFLMPSKFEPCGITQMIAMKYGAIPIVRDTGGLHDTVIEYPLKGANGFKFGNYNSSSMFGAINYAIQTFDKKDKWVEIVNNAMNANFSWEKSANEYRKIYESLIVNKITKN